MTLDVCISAYGLAGLERIASLPHPAMPGVRYVVAWQYGQDSPHSIPEPLLAREDFIIIPTPTKGLGVNRRIALDHAGAEIVLTSDDDVSYTPEYLRDLIRAFEERPECDFLTFRYHSSSNPRPYPDFEFDLREAPKSYFFGGPEIAFRLDAVRRNRLNYDPLFGVGAEFPSGEDDLIVHDMMQAGLQGKFVPLTIAGHESDSTGMRGGVNPEYIRAKGAVFSIIHPSTWPLRMIAHALRQRVGLGGRMRYCGAWLRGVRDLRRLRK